MARRVILLLLVLSGCAPTSDIIQRAETRIEEARSVDAPKHAPEYFFAAEDALHQAKEFQVQKNALANTRANEAFESANRAYEIARLGFDLDRSRGAAVEESERLRAEIARLEDERRRLRAESERTSADRDRLRTEIEEKNRTIAMMTAENTSLGAENSSLAGQISTLEADRSRLQSDRTRLAQELEERAEELKRMAERGDALAADLDRLGAERRALEASLAERNEALEAARADATSLRSEIEAREGAVNEAKEHLEQLRVETERLKMRTDELDSDRLRMTSDLTAANEALEAREAELAKMRSENEKVMADLQGLASEQVKLREEAGRIILTFVDRILFESGKSDIEPEGRAVLAKVAKVLTSHPERMIQIAGHTDSVPITGGKFASNWELSSDRAVKVLRFLLDSEPGLTPERFVASGFGEFHPVESNNTPEGRSQNRRVEIVILRGRI